MSLFQSLARKIKSTSAFTYLTQLLSSSTKQWDAETLKRNIKDLLVQLDFSLNLANSIANTTVNMLSSNTSISFNLVKEKLINTLQNHYSENTNETEERLFQWNKVITIKPDQCNVFFIVGSNGVGKTSFIAKLVHYLKVNHFEKNILLVAGDTFRAGAINQLEQLAKNLKVDILLPEEKESAGALIYRTLKNNTKYDLIIFDSSGRQYNNQNLLAEIKKHYSIIKKLLNKDPEETFLLIDSTLGIYSHQELEKILPLIPITGLVLTKMDSTTRGGAIYNLKPKFSMPIKFICFGEKPQDINIFNISSITQELVENILSEETLMV